MLSCTTPDGVKLKFQVPPHARPGESLSVRVRVPMQPAELHERYEVAQQRAPQQHSLPSSHDVPQTYGVPGLAESVSEGGPRAARERPKSDQERPKSGQETPKGEPEL